MSPFPLKQHPLRDTLANEVHARPFQTLSSPVRASYMAFALNEEEAKADYLHVTNLAAAFFAPPPEPGARYYAATLDKLQLRWERHNEFSTYLFIQEEQEPQPDPFADPVVALLPKDWLTALPGQLVVGLHLVAEPRGKDPYRLASLFAQHETVGSVVDGGRAEVWTDFRVHEDGFARMVIQDDGLTPQRLGRLIQRLIEIETYRMMALLGFPVARDAGAQIHRFDQELAQLTVAMHAPQSANADRELLERLSQLGTAAEALATATSYRFSASRAYSDLVQSRLADLREERISGSQTLQEFLSRRLLPAVNTCVWVDQRLKDFTQRLARTGQWLHTRVGIAVEQQNSELLASMDKRMRLQIKLQETIEGFSTVAISYYMLGLLSYLIKGAEELGVPFSAELMIALAVPLVVLAVAVGVGRIRRNLFKRKGEDQSQAPGHEHHA